MCTSLSLNSLSRSSRLRSLSLYGRATLLPFLELEAQAAFARTIRQGFDAPVIAVAASIEHHGLDTGFDRAFGEQLADRGRRRLIGPGLKRALQALLEARSRHQRRGARIVDQLGINVLGGAEHGQAGPVLHARERATHAQLALVELCHL